MMIAVRVDASQVIGTGHVMRCLTLADGLVEKGAHVCFVCREPQGHLCDLIERRGFTVCRLSAPKLSSKFIGSGYASWLGVSEDQDARETLKAIAPLRADWLVVDHYALGRDWEAAMRPVVGRILAIDDLARTHDCDLLLDQNYTQGMEARYQGLVPQECRCLLGPPYALLRKEYSQLRKTIIAHDGTVRRALIFFGGSDSEDLTGLAMEAMSREDLRHLELDIQPGADNRRRAELNALAAKRGRATIHGQLPHLADLIAKADLGIGAGGTTTWERLCLGLPSLVIAAADNQVPSCRALADADVIEFLGDSGHITPEGLVCRLRRVLGDPDRLIDLSRRGKQMVDGQGTQRVLESMQ